MMRFWWNGLSTEAQKCLGFLKNMFFKDEQQFWARRGLVNDRIVILGVTITSDNFKQYKTRLRC